MAGVPHNMRTMLESHNGENEVKEMAQLLRALATLPEALGSIPSMHAAAHNCLYLRLQGV